MPYFDPNAQNSYYSQPGMMGATNPMASSNPSSASTPSNWGSGIGDLAEALFMHGADNYKNPADSAMPYLNQVPGTVSPYYNPYIDAGRSALTNVQGQYGQLTNDPGAVMNRIGSGFQQSPGYQFSVNQATGAANRAAAAGGMLGSGMHQQNIATQINGLANQDYYNYLNHGMNLYDTGLSGMSDINHMGYNASDRLAQSLKDNLESQSNLAYAGQANQNEHQGGMAGGIGSLIGNGIGAIGKAMHWF